jgi:hypothetical protein
MKTKLTKNNTFLTSLNDTCLHSREKRPNNFILISFICFLDILNHIYYNSKLLCIRVMGTKVGNPLFTVCYFFFNLTNNFCQTKVPKIRHYKLEVFFQCFFIQTKWLSHFFINGCILNSI